MKLEIELDLKKIDYDAINRQIHEKIKEMDLSKIYDINSKIDRKIKDEVEDCVESHLVANRWTGELNDATRRHVNDELIFEIRKLTSPLVDKIFSQITNEELNKIIIELMPKVLVELMCNQLGGALTNYYYQASEHLVSDAACRIRNSIGY